jgi:hypothetical protein
LRSWRLSLWPSSLFGQLFFAVFIGVLAATLISLLLVSRERDRTLVQASVREWSRRVVDMTASMQLLQPGERIEASSLLQDWPRPQFRRSRPRPPPQTLLEPLLEPPGTPAPIPDFRQSLQQQLRLVFGPGYQVTVTPTTDLRKPAMTLSRPGAESFERGGQLFDVSVSPPGGDTLLFRLAQGQRGAPLPRSLLFNLILLAVLIAIALYAVTAASPARCPNWPAPPRPWAVTSASRRSSRAARGSCAMRRAPSTPCRSACSATWTAARGCSPPCLMI